MARGGGAGPLGPAAGVECDISLSATLSLATGAEGTAYATGKESQEVTVSNLSPHDPGNPVDATGCSVLNQVLKPHTTDATFQAPLIFYSTLTHF